MDIGVSQGEARDKKPETASGIEKREIKERGSKGARVVSRVPPGGGEGLSSSGMETSSNRRVHPEKKQSETTLE